MFSEGKREGEPPNSVVSGEDPGVAVGLGGRRLGALQWQRALSGQREPGHQPRVPWGLSDMTPASLVIYQGCPTASLVKRVGDSHSNGSSMCLYNRQSPFMTESHRFPER